MAIVRILLLGFFLGACTVHHSGLDERPLVARVGGVPIYADDFKHELARVRLDGQDGLPAAGTEEAQKRALLDNLIERQLVVQEAERKNVIVGSDEVETAFARSHAGWRDEDWRALLKDKDVTPTELKAELRELLLVRKYFREHVFSRVAVTDQEIETYLSAHPEMLLSPEQVRARQLVVKTEEEAQHILQEIKEGLPFEDAAMKYSLSPDGKTGGDLGFFARGYMPSVFDETCFNLTPGQVSGVVASDYGFHLFKVLEKKPEQARPLDQAREAAERILRRQRESEAEAAKVAELKKGAVIDIKEDQLARIH